MMLLRGECQDPHTHIRGVDSIRGGMSFVNGYINFLLYLKFYTSMTLHSFFYEEIKDSNLTSSLL